MSALEKNHVIILRKNLYLVFFVKIGIFFLFFLQKNTHIEKNTDFFSTFREKYRYFSPQNLLMIFHSVGLKSNYHICIIYFTLVCRIISQLI